MLQEISETDGPTSLSTDYKEYYQSQTKHTLGGPSERLSVPIWIADNISRSNMYKRELNCSVKSVHSSWELFLRKAVNDINVAAPGLHLYFVPHESDSHKVCIYGIQRDKTFVVGNIFQRKTAFICLHDNVQNKMQTSVCKILRLLGFGHESMFASTTLQPSFDPFSVMLHGNDELSELDKVGLNIIFKPVAHGDYNPKISPQTNLYYCGRMVMSRHNYPDSSTTDGYCGPDNWANCPACRTLKTDQIQEIWGQDKWQGWSGVVYCGKFRDGQKLVYCGPHYGLSCSECEHILKYGSHMHTTSDRKNDNHSQADCVIS